MNSNNCPFFNLFRVVLNPIYFIFCWAFISISTFALASNFELISKNANITGFIGQDQLGKIYTIENGVLTKITSTHNLTYSNKQYGAIASVDISDPLNIIVFFKDFGKIVLLDKNLIEKRIIKASSLPLQDMPQLVCHSSQYGFWAFFLSEFRIASFDFRANPIIISNDLSMNFTDIGNANFMIEYNEKLFVSANGILVFDIFTNFLFKIPHIKTNFFQIIDNDIFYVKDDKLYVYNFFLKKENVILLPQKQVNTFFVIDKNTILLQTEQALKKYYYSSKFY